MDVTKHAALKILDRIETARRLGGMFTAEAAGMFQALRGEPETVPTVYVERAEREAYVRGYKDAREIIVLEETLAARLKTAPGDQPAVQG